MTALVAGPTVAPATAPPPHRWTGRAVAAASVLLAPAATVAPWFAGGWVVLLDFGPGPLGTGEVFDGGRLPSGPAFTVPVALLGEVAGERVTAVVALLVLVALGLAGRSLAAALGCGATASSIAAVASAWNPFVFDRLHAGQLATLAATAATIAVAARGVGGRSTAWWMALAAACSVQFLAYSALVGLLVPRRALRRRVRDVALAAGITALWLVPLLPAAPPTGGAAAAEAFGTRADPQLGRALGVAAGSGFWRPPVEGVGAALGSPWVVAVVALLAVVLVGVRRLPPHGRGLVAVGITGWLLAHGSAGPLGAIHRWVLVHVPATGAFREAHKAASLVLVLTVAGVALAVDRHGRGGHRRAAAVLALVVLAAPGQLWGLGGRVVAVAEPATWAEVRRTLAAADPPPSTVVVLPWSSHLRPVLGGGRLLEDPTRRFVVAEAIRRTASGIPGTPLEEGDPVAAGVARAVADPSGAAGLPGRLAALGIRWLLVVDDAAGVDAGLRWGSVDGVEVVARGDGIALYRIDDFAGGGRRPA